jgi:creatinine amidohydrolase
MYRPYILAETNWKEVKDTDFQIAVLPWGATEAHNYHLPYATDNIESEHIAAEAARIAWEKGVKLIVLPNIPFGVNTGQADVRLDINIYPTTQLMILTDIAETLNRQGIRKLVILNSHGGNDFKMIVRELGAKYRDMLICLCNWYQWSGKDAFFERKGDHADEMETSLLLYLTPELVRPLNEAGEGIDKKCSIKALQQGWFWAERRWSQITADTGIGNPKAATREKGEKFFKAITAEIASVFVELDQSDPKNLYA